jgi:hypothetical protein
MNINDYPVLHSSVEPTTAKLKTAKLRTAKLKTAILKQKPGT